MVRKVAVLNTDVDTLDGLALALSDAGFLPCVLNTRGTSPDQVQTFLGTSDPDVVVYDIAPPYLDALRHWNDLRRTTSMRGKPFVLTTTGRGFELGCFGDVETEIIEKPFSFGRLVRAVHRAIRRCKKLE